MSLKSVRPKKAYVKRYSEDGSVGYYQEDDISGEHSLVSIEKAIRIAKDNRKLHKKRHYMSLHPNPDDRYRLKVHTVNKQFERYNKGESELDIDRGYDESMTHKCAVEALSRMQHMKFIFVGDCKHKPLEFDFTSIRKEPYLNLPNSATYYPDVLCTFEEDHEMYDQWGGKLAIEVKYKHGCESYKIEDFMFHNIPVLELFIKNDTFRQFPAERPDWPEERLWGPELVEKHINDLISYFEEGIYVTLIVNPISTRVHHKVVRKLISDFHEEKSLLEQQIEESDSKVKLFSNELNSERARTQRLKSEVDSSEQKLQRVQDRKQEEIDNQALALERFRNTALLEKKKNQIKNWVVYAFIATMVFLPNLVVASLNEVFSIIFFVHSEIALMLGIS
ncbi:hypothetical protein L4C37_19905 [Vibrio kagoshimensis]|uniref:hypothetical protein n=1 Tax=Vibrio kagoshimensis TaxID=2910244 RepID=UPI003D1C4045